MTDSLTLDQATEALSDPTTTADTLYGIAATHTGLWARVAAHPNAYDDLLAWLNDVGDPSVRAAVAARRRVISPANPAAGFVRPPSSITLPPSIANAFRGSHPGPATPYVASSLSHITPPVRDLSASWRDLTPRPAPLPVRDLTDAPLIGAPRAQAVAAPPQVVLPPAWSVPDSTPPAAPEPQVVAPTVLAVMSEPSVVAPEPDEVAPAPVAASAPRPLAPATAASTTPRWMRPALIVLAIAVLLVVALLVYLLTSKSAPGPGAVTAPTSAGSAAPTGSAPPSTADLGDLASAQTAFTSAAAEYDTVQAGLGQAIAAATTGQAPVAVPAGELTNPELLTTLTTALADAKAAVAPAPTMAATAPEITRQTAQLQADTITARSATTALTAATAAVQADRVTAAQGIIGTAVTAAQSVYDGSKGLADETARAALLTGITNAKAASDTLKTADPATVHATATEWKTQLEKLSQAVLDTKQTKCTDNVTLPAGVDPRVCSGVPEGAIAFPMTSDGTGMFQMPSGNIGCTADAYGITLMCEIKSASWSMPAEVHATCQGDITGECGGHEIGLSQGFLIQVAHGDVAPWADATSRGVAVPTLQYGQIAVSGTGACMSTQDGVTCWDMMSSHGFRMSAQSLLTW